MKDTKLIAGALLAVLAGQAAAQSCGWTVASVVPTPTPVESLEAAGNLLFATTSSESFNTDAGAELRVYDISDRGSPVLIGQLALPCNASALQVIGDTAYAAYRCTDGSTGCDPIVARDGGLLTIDVSDPTSPSILGCLAAEERAFQLAVAPPYVYYPNFRDGRIGVIRVTDLSDPRLLRFTPFDGTIASVAIVGDTLVTSVTESATNALRTFDLSDPSRPERLAFVDFGTQRPESLLADADSVVVRFTPSFGGSFFFREYDLSNPSAPEVILDQSWPDRLISNEVGTTIVGNRVYSGRLTYLLDVQTVDDAITLPMSQGGDHVYTLGFLYAAGTDGIEVIPDTAKSLADVIPSRTSAGADASTGVAAANGVLFETDETGVIRAIEYPDYLSPSLRDEIPTIGVTRGIAARSDAVFLANELPPELAPDLGVLEVVEYDDGSLTTIAAVDLEGVAIDLALDGTMVYAATRTSQGDGLIEVFDASDPNDPMFTGAQNIGDPVLSMVAEDSVAYGSTGDEFIAIDVSRPEAPLVVATIPLSGLGGLSISDGLVTAADDDGSLVVIDVSVPSAPSLIGAVPLDQPVLQTQLDGSLVYLSTGNGISVADVSDPLRPLGLLRAETMFGGTIDEFVQNSGTVFASSGNGLVLAYDVSLCTVPCDQIDLALPYGTLDLLDIDAYLFASATQDLAADLAAPQGVFDLDDVDAFISAFLAGCP